jgi:hypothetical protein
MSPIEDAATKVVEAYERQTGRTPENVSSRGVGYDFRYTEWQTAHRMRGRMLHLPVPAAAIAAIAERTG